MHYAEMKLQRMQVLRCGAEGCSKREFQIARAEPRQLKHAKDERMLKAVAVKRAKKLQAKDRERQRDGKYFDQEDTFEELPADGKKTRQQDDDQSSSTRAPKQTGNGEQTGKGQDEVFTTGARGAKDVFL